MITIFSAEEYLERENISDIEEDCLDVLDKIIALEIAMFNMKNCKAYNINIIDELKIEMISLFENKSNLTYISHN